MYNNYMRLKPTMATNLYENIILVVVTSRIIPIALIIIFILVSINPSHTGSGGNRILTEPDKNVKSQISTNYAYSREPAPMGIADYGIGYNNVPYEYNTTSFMGIVNITYIHTYNSSINSTLPFGRYGMSVQLNTVMRFSSGEKTYVYWAQNVAVINTSDNEIAFIDNVWNMSSQDSVMKNSTISGNGSIYGNAYIASASEALPGNYKNLKTPFFIKFITNVTEVNGRPELIFMYNDGYGWVTYDSPEFKFVSGLTAKPVFTVNGYKLTPSDNYYDAELVLGGPGNGTKTVDEKSNIEMYLKYWNGHNYQMITNAFNYGSDTQEGICNVTDTYKFNNGFIYASVINSSSNNELKQIYNLKDVTLVNISSNLKSGYISINGTMHQFFNCDANLTLAPGYYNITIYSSNRQVIKSEFYQLRSGEYLHIFAGAFYKIILNESGLPVGTKWYVNYTYSTSNISNSIIIMLKNGYYSLNISSANKDYRPENYTINIKVSGNNQTVNITFIPVLFNINIIEHGLGPGQKWTIIINGTKYETTEKSISLDEMNGTYEYKIPETNGFYSSNPTGIIRIIGNNVTINIYYHKGMVDELQEYLYLFVAGIIVAASIFIIFKKRKRR